MALDPNSGLGCVYVHCKFQRADIEWRLIQGANLEVNPLCVMNEQALDAGCLDRILATWKPTTQYLHRLRWLTSSKARRVDDLTFEGISR
jgi:hypothetical protein